MNAPGSETGPGSQLVTWGKSTILSVDAHGFKFEYTLNSAKHIPLTGEDPDRSVVYEGLREDKPTRDVRRQIPHPQQA
jgi:hypothetical protein